MPKYTAFSSQLYAFKKLINHNLKNEINQLQKRKTIWKYSLWAQQLRDAYPENQ